MPLATPDVTAELFEVILDERDPACDMVVGECPRPARWAFRCAGCGYDMYSCDEHRKRWDRDGLLATHWRCFSCNTRQPVPVNWRPI
jgi:hypothetical protein